MSSFRILTPIILFLGILLLSGGLFSSYFYFPLRTVRYQASGLNPAVSQIPPAEYDVQLGMTFTQDFTSLGYNVTAVAQSDAYGYGPAYLLNGVSNIGYWYQVGVAYNWPYNQTGGYSKGFNFVYEVFDPSGRSVFPVGGGGLLSFSGPVNSGDLVLLNLYFSGGNVIMYAKDWNTGATASSAYSDWGATYFMGFPSATQSRSQFFTGLMTEWYHVDPYSGDEQRVTYSNYGFALSSAWMWMDEWDPSNSSWSGAWSDYTSSPVQFSSIPNQFQSLTSHNFTVASNAYEFVTGYSGTTTAPPPVENPINLSLSLEVTLVVVTILTLIDVYVFLRRHRNSQVASPTYLHPTV